MKNPIPCRYRAGGLPFAFFAKGGSALLVLVLFQSDQMITEKEIRTGAGARWDRIRALLNARDPATDDRTIDVSPPPTRDDPSC